MADINAEFLKQRYGGGAADPNAAFLQARFGGGAVSAPPPGTVKSIADSLAYGFENTGMVMLMRGKGPNQQMPDDAPWYYRAAAGVGGLAGDFLPGVAGAVAGTAGGPVGQMAGGFALPMALREGVVEAYNGGHALDFNGVLEIGKAALKGGAKGAVIGAATGGAGKALAPVLGQSVKGAVALTAAEVGVMTTVSSTLEGRVPSWQDFMDNAILLGGVKAAVGTAKTLRNVWAQTGKTPAEVRADAARDPRVALDLKPLETPTSSEKMVEAYHGSPHKFDKFDLSKVGTGEGAQAFGYGLYFADNPVVAKSYKGGTGALIAEPHVGGRPLSELPKEMLRTWELQTAGKSYAVFEELRKVAAPGATLDFYIREGGVVGDFAAELKKLGVTNAAAGYDYKVQIPQRVVDSMLDWDKPLSQQSEAVKKAFAKAEVVYGPLRGGKKILDPESPIDGHTAYRDLATVLNEGYVRRGGTAAKADKVVSDYLRGIGVQGIRYLDQGSRDAGKGTSNYVLFDAEHVRVVERNGEAVSSAPFADRLPPAYEPLALEQRVQAALDKDPRPEAVRKILTDPNWKPTADDPPPVRTEYITDRESLAGIYGEVGRVYAKDIEFARRGERSNAATMVDAYNMVFGGKLEPHKIGAAENAETIAGRLIVAKSALLRAEQAVAAVKADPLNKAAQLDFYATMELLANVQKDARAAVAEWGRAGQIQRAIKRDPAMLVDAEALLAHVEKTQKAPFGEIVAMFDKLRDPANKMAFAEKAMESGGLAKIVEVWRAGIFSGPLTWEANILGNVGKWATDVVERPIAALIEAGMSKTPLKASQVKARAFAPLYGLEMAVLDGLKFFSETADLVKSQGWGAAGKRLNQVIEGQGDKIDVLRSANDPNSANPLERGAAGFSKFSFGALKLQDIPFRTIGERMEAYKLAVDRVARETDYHPSTTEWKQAVMRYVNEPTLGLTAEGGLAVTKAIEAAGDAQVFSQPLGKRASMASAAISGTPWEFLFPARRTPINLLDWAVQHTPGANFLSSRWRADFQAGGERQAQALARVVVGTSLAATAYGLTQSGLLTGGGLADKDMNATKEGARVPNYALKVGGTYYSVARIEPVAKLFMLAGDLAEIAKSPKLTEEDRGKAISMMVLAFANATVSTTYLSGLANAMKAVTDPERYGQSLVEGYATSVVPKVVGQPTTMADPYKREVDGVIEAIQSQIPFLREQLVAKRDVWGQKVENERLFGVMPIGTSKAAEEKVKTEAMRLYLGLARAPEYIMERGPLKPTDKRTKLSHEQRDVLQEVSGKFAMQELSRVVSSPDWDRLPAFAQIKVYKDVMESATKIGTVAALPPDAPERVARRQKILQAIIRQSQEAESR